MKTSGVFHIPRSIILIAVTIFTISPASAQLYFASQKIFSTKGADKEIAFYKNTYDIIRSGNNENNGFSYSSPENSFEISLPARNISFKTININDSASLEASHVSKEEIEFNFRTTSFEYPTNSKRDIGISEFSPRFLVVYAKALKEYAKKNDFDTSYVFLSNMGMLCNKKRFFVVNLATMEIEEAGLVSHGRGQGPTIYDKQYSDEPGSRSTSLGRYKIVSKYKGNY
ncbi:MAG TPA: murein L,D-transpeptidase catalytic domain family protein, partial [Chitinophagaceae bacterium]|nr:murein L,D-transpeptidase catalytic domain family protein [Chitinophagaceae bacterium]